jgi:hypothetical protein
VYGCPTSEEHLGTAIQVLGPRMIITIHKKEYRTIPPLFLPCGNAGFTIDQLPLSSTSVN